jgi:maltose alpha-D-glucosyltransferase/alpha-amylase
VIDDPTFGFEQVNVASQLANPGSLLQWFQGVLAVRRQHPAFGRGTVRLLALDAPAVLAYAREYVDETLVIFNNLSPSSQNVAIDFTAGQTLIDLFTGERITFLTQFTLEGHGYRWFRLS